MATVLLAGLASWIAAAPPPIAIKVVGDTSCPSAAAVSAALDGLVAAPAGAPDVVELTGPGVAATVRLRTAAGELVAEKRLPESPACEERAQAAAVIVAAWEAHLRAGAAPMWPLPASSPAPASKADVPTLAAAAPAPLPRPIHVDTSVAALGSIAADHFAPGAMLEAMFSRGDSAFALGVGALAVGSHSVTLASGRGTWSRYGGVVDLQSSALWPAAALQLHAGLALTALSVAGESLPTTKAATLFDPGTVVGVRLRYRGERVSPWLEVAAAFWPRPHTLFVSGSAASTELPANEVLLGVGLSVGQNH